MVKRLIPLRLHRHWDAYREASEIWRSKVRSVHYERAVSLFVAVVISELFCVWLAHVTVSTIEDPLLRAIYELITGLENTIGVFTVALAFLAIYTYTLVTIQYLLPGFVALLVTAGSFLANQLFNVKSVVILGAAWIYPPEFRPQYRELAGAASPLVTAVMTLSTLVMLGLSFYAQGQIVSGLLRDGPQFRNSDVYQRWVAHDSGLPKVRHMLVDVTRTALASGNAYSYDAPERDTRNDAPMPRGRPDSGYRTARRRARRRQRASRRANRRR